MSVKGVNNCVVNFEISYLIFLREYPENQKKWEYGVNGRFQRKGKRVWSGTIPILRQHIFELFITHPPINSTDVRKKLRFF